MFLYLWRLRWNLKGEISSKIIFEALLLQLADISAQPPRNTIDPNQDRKKVIENEAD